MKIASLVLLVLSSFAAHQLCAYTWTVRNNTKLDDVSIEVCTTAGIDNCQTQTLKNGQRGTFKFSEWYNTGLCLGQVKVNGAVAGIPSPDWLKDPARKEITVGTIAGRLITAGKIKVSGILAALSIADYCGDSDLGISMGDDQKPLVYKLLLNKDDA